MSYMVHQALTTAIRDAFRERDDAAEQAATAASCRAWLEALPVASVLRASLVEPIAAIEDGLRAAERERDRGPDR